MTQLEDLQAEIGRINEEHGFNEMSAVPEEYWQYYVSTKLMLMVSELAEAQDEFRNGRGITETYYPEPQIPLSLVAEVGDVDEARAAWRAHLAEDDKPKKPEGLPSELADAVIRAFSLAYELGIDLEASINEKMKYNDSRPYKHGKAF